MTRTGVRTMLAPAIFLLLVCFTGRATAFVSWVPSLGGMLTSPSLRQAACTSSPLRVNRQGGRALQMSSQSEVDSEHKVKDSTTKLVQMGDSFNEGRKYLLDVDINPRDYCWTIENVEELCEAIFQEIDDGKAEASSATSIYLGKLICCRRDQDSKNEMKIGVCCNEGLGSTACIDYHPYAS